MKCDITQSVSVWKWKETVLKTAAECSRFDLRDSHCE